MTEIEQFITDQEINITTHRDFIIFRLGKSENEYYAKWVTIEPIGKKNNVIYETWRDLDGFRQNV